VLDTAARLILSPLLITQALRVRRTAQSLPEAAGPRSGVTGSGPALRLAIIGDSSGAGVGVKTQADALLGQITAVLSQDFTLHWHLDALIGATTRSTLARLERAEPRPFDVIITALGVNDVTRLIPAAIWLRQQDSLFARLNSLYQPRHIYVSGMPPLSDFPLLPDPLRWTLGRHAATLDRHRVRRLAADSNITHVPFDLPLDPAMMAADGFHPGPQIYALWAKEMASRIISDWPEYAG
jgi:lysophospholipase L1-like esterase